MSSYFKKTIRLTIILIFGKCKIKGEKDLYPGVQKYPGVNTEQHQHEHKSLRLVSPTGDRSEKNDPGVFIPQG